VRLGWTGDPARSITVLWDAPPRDPGRLRIRSLDGEWREWAASPESVVDCEGRYQLEIGALAPHTTYEYAIEYEAQSGALWSDARAFSTAPASGAYSGVYTSAFVASTGLAGAPSSPHAARVMAELARQRPDLVLGGGGYAYSADAPELAAAPLQGIERWLQQLLPVASRAPFLPVYGETELAGSRHREDVEYYRRRHPSLDRFAAQAGSYSFDVGATHYAALHAVDGESFDPATARGQAQLDWLRTDLLDASQRGLRFTIVYMHADLYSTHSASLLSGSARNALLALFDERQVDLVLSGDTPGFERSHPLRAGVAHPAPGPIVERAHGTIYLRSGAGGREDHLAWQPGPPPGWLAQRDASMKSIVLIHQIDAELLMVEVLGLPEPAAAPVQLDFFVLL
jgi:hypothetical protein